MATPKKKGLKSFKTFDPKKYIETEPTLAEAVKAETVVFTFGRMNPMTIGHEKLINKITAVARSEKAQAQVYLSHSSGAKSKSGKGAVNKNPLTYDDKIKYAQKAFGPTVTKSRLKTLIDIAKDLSTKYKNLVMVAGSDRVDEYDKLLNKYNGKDFKFDSIKVVSAGDRDPDGEGAAGMSGTKMREFAKAGDVRKFKTGLPKGLQSNAAEIMKKIQTAQINESIDEAEVDSLDEVLSREQRRKKGLMMRKIRHKIKRGREKAKRKMASQDTLKKRARKSAIEVFKKKFSKQRRYADLSPGEKMQVDKRIAKINKNRIEKMARKFLPIVKQKERDRRKSAMQGGATKKESLNIAFENFLNETTGKYYTGVATSKKDDREDHFERNAKKADNDPSAYKPAPGDKEAKTKESKHTKKARAMGLTDDYNEAFELFLDESNLWGQKVMKRPHMLLDRNGKTKFDGRFKMYKPKLDEELDTEVASLMEATEAFEASELNEDPSKSLAKKAEKSGMPAGVLRSVYKRGVAAWKTGHRPGTTPEQWGHARVNSFITKSSGTWGKADKDLAAKVRKEEVQLAEASQDGDTKIVTVGSRHQVMIKQNNAWVNHGAPYKSRGDAEKVRDNGHHELLQQHIDRHKMSEAAMDNMCCKDCGDMFGKPKTESCKYNAFDMKGENWIKKESYKEEAEINELDKSTLGSYIKKATDDVADNKKVDQRVKGAIRAKIKMNRKDSEIKEDYRMTKIYNPSTKKSRAAGVSTATYAVHTPDRKYFKEFPNQKDAENHHKDMMKKVTKESTEQLDELSPETMMSYKQKADYSADSAVRSATAKMLRGKDKNGNRADHSPELNTIKKRKEGERLYTKRVGQKLRKDLAARESAGEFTPHMMYDPKTGEGKMTNKEAEHLKLKDMGWSHDKPKVQKEYTFKKLRKSLDEKLKPSDSMGDYIKDFQDSDAPQFKGKSDKKKREMAIAAKLSNEAFGRARLAQNLKKQGMDVDKVHAQNVKDAAAAKKRQSAASRDLADFRKKNGINSETTVDETSMQLPTGLSKAFDKDKEKLKKEIEAMKDRLKNTKNEEGGAGDQGTNELVNKYKKDTPNA